MSIIASLNISFTTKFNNQVRIDILET